MPPFASNSRVGTRQQARRVQFSDRQEGAA